MIKKTKEAKKKVYHEVERENGKGGEKEKGKRRPEDAKLKKKIKQKKAKKIFHSENNWKKKKMKYRGESKGKIKKESKEN